jgi:hypothetical protein
MSDRAKSVNHIVAVACFELSCESGHGVRRQHLIVPSNCKVVHHAKVLNRLISLRVPTLVVQPHSSCERLTGIHALEVGETNRSASAAGLRRFH